MVIGRVSTSVSQSPARRQLGESLLGDSGSRHKHCCLMRLRRLQASSRLMPAKNAERPETKSSIPSTKASERHLSCGRCHWYMVQAGHSLGSGGMLPRRSFRKCADFSSSFQLHVFPRSRGFFWPCIATGIECKPRCVSPHH